MWCITQLTLLNKCKPREMSKIPNFHQASYQGLAENLAAFYAKAGKAVSSSKVNGWVAPGYCFSCVWACAQKLVIERYLFQLIHSGKRLGVLCISQQGILPLRPLMIALCAGGSKGFITEQSPVPLSL